MSIGCSGPVRCQHWEEIRLTRAAAIIGTGFMGATHAEALRRIGVPVLGILGSCQDNSEVAARVLGAVKAYSNFQDLLSDPHIDVVHLCVPNALHFSMARDALQAGKHVICEKPLAMTSAESAHLVTLAEANRLGACVCYNLRYYPTCQHSRFMVESGALGEVLHINGSYVQDWLLKETDFNWRVLAEQSGPLRAVSDIGTHWLDLIQHISGLEVEAVFADLKTFLPTRKRTAGRSLTFSEQSDEGEFQEIAVDTEDYGVILIRFVGGARASLHVSQVCAGRKNALRYEIAGAKAALSWDSESPNHLWIGRRDEPNEILLKDPALLGRAGASISSYPGGHAEGYPDTFKQLFKSFYGYISTGDFSATPTFPTFADGHMEVRLCDAVLESAREEKWVMMR